MKIVDVFMTRVMMLMVYIVLLFGMSCHLGNVINLRRHYEFEELVLCGVPATLTLFFTPKVALESKHSQMWGVLMMGCYWLLKKTKSFNGESLLMIKGFLFPLIKECLQHWKILPLSSKHSPLHFLLFGLHSFLLELWVGVCS